MNNSDLQSENRKDIHFQGLTGGSAAAWPAVKEIETVAAAESAILISGENGARRDALYKAVMALSRSIAGRTDMTSLIAGVADSLRPIISFDHIGLILHDPNGTMQGHI